MGGWEFLAERYRNGATQTTPNINQTDGSASPSPTCSPSSFASLFGEQWGWTPPKCEKYEFIEWDHTRQMVTLRYVEKIGESENGNGEWRLHTELFGKDDEDFKALSLQYFSDVRRLSQKRREVK